jgi:hypothetical protein
VGIGAISRQASDEDLPTSVPADHVEARLTEGACVATVRLELSAIRGLFQFMLDMKRLGRDVQSCEGRESSASEECVTRGWSERSN